MVDGVAMAKKHQRASGRASGSTQLQQGGIIDVEMFIDISNVQIVCKSCGQATRVGYRIDGDDEGADLQEVRGGTVSETTSRD